MKNLLTMRIAPSILALASLTAISFAQDFPNTSGGDGGNVDDPYVVVGGGNDGTTPPDPIPEPFTMALGAGAVALYARRRLSRSAGKV